MKNLRLLTLAASFALGCLPAAAAEVDPFQNAPRATDLRFTISTDAASYDSCAKIVVLAAITNLLDRPVLVEDRLTRVAVVDSNGNAIQPSGTSLLMTWALGATAVSANGEAPAGRYVLANLNFRDSDCKPGAYKLTAYRVLRSGPLISNTVVVTIK
jgi:hypothetical protein